MTHKRNYKDTNNALVLTGGGARAAYQVGVLSAIAKFVPRNHGIPFPIISGTSAGAINSTSLACYASCFHLGVKKLEWVWKNLRPNSIYHSDALHVLNNMTQGLFSTFQADYATKTSHSLLNNAPLRDLLNKVIDYKRIDNNILNGYLSAISVAASGYSNGDSISFYQSDESISPWARAKRKGIPCQINNDHLMASSAIPLIFPSVNIKNEHFGDGSIHQLSPLSPAIHLGAERILIVGVEQPKAPITNKENNPHPPSTATVAGHLLDTIFSDTMQSDLERMTRINETLKLIPSEVRQNKIGLKHIDTLVINPTEDFNVMAMEFYHKLPISIRLLLRSIGISRHSESSLVSYLLFERNYCQKLIKLGYNDALHKETEIKHFLSLK